MRGRQVREERRHRAEERATARARRTPSGQLAVIDARLGEGEGAVRERVKLLRQIEATAAKPSPKVRKERKEGTKAKDRRRDSRNRSRNGTRARGAD